MGTKPLAYLSVHSEPIGAKLSQKHTIAWLMKALQKVPKEISGPRVSQALNLYEKLLTSSRVEQRYSVVDDYTHFDWSKMNLFSADRKDWYLPPLERRMLFFSTAAEEIAHRLFDSEELAPNYLIQVSCTGYDSPNAIQKYVLSRQWQQSCRLMSIGHMGCYAAIPSTHLASQLVQAGNRVSLLHIELCSLHLKPASIKPHQMVMNTLFSDGAVRLDCAPMAVSPCLALWGSSETLIEGSLSEMTWTPADAGFSMSLGKAVPRYIGKHLKPCLTEFLGVHGLSLEDIDRFAIHPGGPKIIDSVLEGLGLDPTRAKESLLVLRTRGNMSSVSIPEVWKRLQEDPKVQDGEWIVSLAFGPGLTLAMNLMQKVGV